MNKFLLSIAQTLATKENLKELEVMPITGFGEVRAMIQRESPDTFRISYVVESTIKLKELKELQNRGIV